MFSITFVVSCPTGFGVACPMGCGWSAESLASTGCGGTTCPTGFVGWRRDVFGFSSPNKFNYKLIII